MDQTGENNDRNDQNNQQDHDLKSLVEQIEKLKIMLKEKDDFIDYSSKHNQALKNMMEGYNSCKNYVKGLEAEVLLLEQEVEQSKEIISKKDEKIGNKNQVLNKMKKEYISCNIKSLQEKVLQLEEVISKENKALENKALILVEKDEEIINTNQVLQKIMEENNLIKNNEECLQAKVVQLEREAQESKELISKERKKFEKEKEMFIFEIKKQAIQNAEKLRALENKVTINNLVIQRADRDNDELKQDKAMYISETKRLQFDNEELRYELKLAKEKSDDA